MNFKSVRLIDIAPFFILLILGTVIYISQLNYDTWRWNSPGKIQTTYNEYIEPEPLSAQATRYASFGATEFTADLYWLKLIQYYGGGDPSGQYRKLAELFNTVTDLSPKFLPAYQTGLLILPGEGFTDQALALSQKGKKNLPDSWEIPYYTGLVKHIYKKDYVAAAEEFNAASKLPGAPEITKYFAALYYNQADQRQVAYALFQTIYQTSTDTYVKDRAQKYLGHLDGEFALEDAVSTFHQKFGRNPATLAELVDKKILSALPTSPLGFEYKYDAQTGQIDPGK